MQSCLGCPREQNLRHRIDGFSRPPLYFRNRENLGNNQGELWTREINFLIANTVLLKVITLELMPGAEGKR